MMRTMCKSKIHRATVTDADLHYAGSITIDESLLERADILPNELVQIVNINNGNRFETYVVKGDKGSGIICINGAAARLVHKGDLVIIISYATYTDEEAKKLVPKIVHVDERNRATG